MVCCVFWKLITVCDLSRLNLTIYLVAHWIFVRSEFNWFAASTGLSTILYRLVSSANNPIDELMFSTISLIYKRTSKGPRIEP